MFRFWFWGMQIRGGNDVCYYCWDDGFRCGCLEREERRSEEAVVCEGGERSFLLGVLDLGFVGCGEEEGWRARVLEERFVVRVVGEGGVV